MVSPPATSQGDAVIVSACRTPIGRFLGALTPLTAPRLGAIAVREAVRRSGLDPTEVTEAVMGCVVTAGLGQNPARQAALGAGLPESASALTVNKVCGSGLEAVALAARTVRAGDEPAVVAGGMESMSNAPHLLRGARAGLRLGPGELVDSVVNDGLWDATNDFHMGMTAELVAREHSISRRAQDEYAVESHRKAVAAMDAGKFKAETVAVEVSGRKGQATRADQDECPRRDTSLEALAALRPAFQPEGGTVTAGNAPGLSDGASALVVTTRRLAEERGLPVLATIRGAVTHGVAPEQVMMAPEGATRKLLDRVAWKIGDVDLFEINEAFAVQQCALRSRLGIKAERHNVNGGAVALGHPIGASGARVLTTLLHAMRDRGASRGVAALCLGGGNAVAMAVEAP